MNTLDKEVLSDETLSVLVSQHRLKRGCKDIKPCHVLLQMVVFITSGTKSPALNPKMLTGLKQRRHRALTGKFVDPLYLGSMPGGVSDSSRDWLRGWATLLVPTM